jgi:hypothetical protein
LTGSVFNLKLSDFLCLLLPIHVGFASVKFVFLHYSSSAQLYHKSCTINNTCSNNFMCCSSNFMCCYSSVGFTSAKFNFLHCYSSAQPNNCSSWFSHCYISVGVGFCIVIAVLHYKFNFILIQFLHLTIASGSFTYYKFNSIWV